MILSRSHCKQCLRSISRHAGQDILHIVSDAFSLKIMLIKNFYKVCSQVFNRQIANCSLKQSVSQSTGILSSFGIFKNDRIFFKLTPQINHRPLEVCDANTIWVKHLFDGGILCFSVPVINQGDWPVIGADIYINDFLFLQMFISVNKWFQWTLIMQYT